jgi:PleD family two-component response regulator
MLAPTFPRSTESKFRLLYLGSDLTLIAALRKELTEPDYRLVACGDRGGAIMFLKSEIPYDVLLIDLEWRGTEGLKLARLTRSLSHRKRMPIILVATELSDPLAEVARRAGVNECVTKTPDMGAVSETIRQMIEGVKR